MDTIDEDSENVNVNLPESDYEEARTHKKRRTSNVKKGRKSDVGDAKEVQEEKNEIDANASLHDMAALLDKHVNESLQENQEALEMLKTTSEKRKSGSAGAILSIDLENFMNHSRFELKFNRKVNIIHAGKSVFSAALALAFGSSASETGRGKKLSDLIQHGKQKAIVKVSIDNTGADAFHKEEWGNLIVITRSITAKTSDYEMTGYNVTIVNNKEKETEKYEKMRSLKGKECRDVVTRLAAHLNIQINNPVMMLTQDVSKQFLQSKNNQDLFNLFMHATSLDSMKKTLTNTEDNLNAWKIELQKVAQNLPVLEKKMNESNKQLQDMEKLEVQKDDLKRFRVELLWAFVENLEKEIKEKEDHLTNYIDEVSRLSSQISDYKEAEASLNQEYVVIREEIDRDNSMLEQHAEKVEAAKIKRKNVVNELNAAKKALGTCVANVKLVENQLAKAKLDREAFVTEFYKNNAEKNEISKIKLEKDKKSKDLDQVRADLKEFENSYKSGENSKKEEIDLEIERLQQGLAKSKKNVQSLQHNKSVLEAGLKNRDSIFGVYSAEVEKEIASKRWKGEKPIGPLGKYIQLKSNTYANCIEVALRFQLDAYIASNFEDSSALKSILKRFYKDDKMPTILVQPASRRYEVPENEFTLPTIASQLSASNDWVFNICVNQASIDRIVLAHPNSSEENKKDLDVANDFVLDPANSNCKEVMFSTLTTISGNSHHKGTFIKRYYESKDFIRGRLVARDEIQQKNDIRRITQEIESENNQIVQIQGELTKQMDAKKKIDSEIKSSESEKKKLSDRAKRLQSEINSLANQMEEIERRSNDVPDTAKFDTKIASLQDDLPEAENEVEKKKSSIEKIELKLQEIVDSIQHIQNPDFDATANKKRVELSNTLVEKLEQISQKIAIAFKTSKQSESKISVQSDDLQTLKSKLEIQMKLVAAYPRVVASLTVKQIEAKIANLEIAVKHASQKFNMDINELQKIASEDAHNFNVMNSKIEIMENRLQQTTDAKVKRDHEWARFRKNIAETVQVLFAQNLEKRGHSGQLTFDFVNQTLSMEVSMNSAISENASDKNTKMLSGGERSFTTLAFVLAVGDSLHTPFRMLDEFDVFMDPVNRRIAMNMLLKKAVLSDGQYILMTPQDVTGIPADKKITIHVLPDPIRNQGVLNFRSIHEDNNDNEDS